MNQIPPNSAKFYHWNGYIHIFENEVVTSSIYITFKGTDPLLTRHILPDVEYPNTTTELFKLLVYYYLGHQEILIINLIKKIF